MKKVKYIILHIYPSGGMWVTFEREDTEICFRFYKGRSYRLTPDRFRRLGRALEMWSKGNVLATPSAISVLTPVGG